MKGRCACGQVTVTIPRAPEFINFCNCSLCRRIGGAWGYFEGSEVEVEGEVRGFIRNDMDDLYLETQFCPTCSAAVRWVGLPERDISKVGVNMRLFDPEELTGIETRFPDGINWIDERPAPRHGPMPYGEGPIY